MSGALLPAEGQRTAALKDKLAALKHNVGRRPRKSATGDTGPAAGDAPGDGDALRNWRQRRGRSDGTSGAADVDWDFIDAAASGEPGSTAARERRNDVTEGLARQFEAAAEERQQPYPTLQSGAGMTGSSSAGGNGYFGEGVGRDGKGGAGGGGGDAGGRDASGSELSFEERLARVLAASAAVLRKAQEREALPPGAFSPPREAQAVLRDGRSPSAGSPTHRGGAASPADVDTIDDVLERWRRQRKAESASLGWAAPPSALAVLAAEQATAVAQQAVETASASLKATPPRQRHAEPVAGPDARSHSADGALSSPEASFDALPVPRRTPPSARRALSLDGSQQQAASSHSPPEAFGRRAGGGSSPVAQRSQAELLQDAVTAALSGLDHASPGTGVTHARSPVSMGYDLFGGDDMAQLLQGTVESMLFGEYAMPSSSATNGGTHTPPAARSPARRGGPPSPSGVDAPAEHGAPWPGVQVSTPPRAAAVPQSPVRTPSPVRLSPSVVPSSPGDEIVDHLKARIAACRLELSQLGL